MGDYPGPCVTEYLPLFPQTRGLGYALVVGLTAWVWANTTLYGRPHGSLSIPSMSYLQDGPTLGLRDSQRICCGAILTPHFNDFLDWGSPSSSVSLKPASGFRVRCAKLLKFRCPLVTRTPLTPWPDPWHWRVADVSYDTPKPGHQRFWISPGPFFLFFSRCPGNVLLDGDARMAPTLTLEMVHIPAAAIALATSAWDHPSQRLTGAILRGIYHAH